MRHKVKKKKEEEESEGEKVRQEFKKKSWNQTARAVRLATLWNVDEPAYKRGAGRGSKTGQIRDDAEEQKSARMEVKRGVDWWIKVTA